MYLNNCSGLSLAGGGSNAINLGTALPSVRLDIKHLRALSNDMVVDEFKISLR